MEIPGSGIELPGCAIGSRPTQHADAWASHPITIELQKPYAAMRVHWQAMKVIGDWYAIGDVVQTSLAFRSKHALPGPFRYIGLFQFQAGTILNVGKCSPLFGQPGGGYQAEFIAGRFPVVQVTDALWLDRFGHA